MQVLGVNLQQAAWFSAAPWAMMAWAGFVAGACSDYLIKVGISITTVRKIMQVISRYFLVYVWLCNYVAPCSTFIS